MANFNAPEGRQYPLVATAVIAFDDYTSGAAKVVIGLPSDATVIGGEVIVDTAWDSATSAQLDVGDGDDPNRYTGSVVNVKTLGRTALTLTGYKYGGSDTIDIIITDVGTPTVGSLRLNVMYVRDGRANEAQD